MIKNCAFCGAKVIRIRRHTAIRRGVLHERFKVDGGILAGKNKTSMSPICDTCWGVATEYLREHHNPLGILVVRTK